MEKRLKMSAIVKVQGVDDKVHDDGHRVQGVDYKVTLTIDGAQILST